MADLTIQALNRSGLNPTLGAANGGGDKFLNDGILTFLYVANGDSTPTNVSFAFQTSPDGQTIPAKTVAVPNGGFRLIGPFPQNLYNDAQGKVNISYSKVTSLTIGAIQLASS